MDEASPAAKTLLKASHAELCQVHNPVKQEIQACNQITVLE
jgi:hypothetical protein